MRHPRADRIQELLAHAVNLPRRSRRAFLDRESDGDAGLRALVEALVEAHEESQTTGAGVDTSAPGSNGHADPEHVGPYRIARKIGEGGMGTVYVAEQTEPIRRTVALKVIKRGMDTDEVLARFEHERQSLALMNHAGIAQVHDAGATADGRPYFVMEHVPGLAITEYCDQNQLTVSERIELFLDVCAAVQHAHQKGIIHRDLKPSNILVTLHDGLPLPKIIDFGLAKSVETRLTDRTVATRLGQIMGTPGYMSPEQMDIAAPDVDTRSDVYALGVILYELLVGVLPFDPESLHAAGYVEVQRIIREVEPPRPSTRFSMLNGASEVASRTRGTDPRTLARHLRGDLDWIVMRCLEKDRARRYASASELAADLERHLDLEPVLAGPPSSAYRLRKFVRKNRGLVAATTLVFAALTTGLAVASYGLIQANHHRDVAEGALRDTQTARDAEKERATQLQQVADFQGEQLSGIDVPLMGIRLRKGLLDGVRAASERGRHSEEETAARVAEVEKLIAGANFTDVALHSLDDNIFARTIEAIDKQFAGQPLVKAQLLQTLSDTLDHLGLLDAAVDPVERALDIRRRALGEEHRDTLSSLCRLAHLLRTRGKFVEAEQAFRAAFETSRRTVGDEDLDTVGAMAGLGLVLIERGQWPEAEEYCRRALDVQRRALGNDDEATLTSINSMSGLRTRQGRLAEAEPYAREVLENRRRTLGNDHPSTLIAINNLGVLLMHQDKFDEAEPYVREAMDAGRRVFGNEHHFTLTAIHSMAQLLKSQRKFAEAEPYVREALEARRLTLGNDHPNTLLSIVSLAGLFQSQGKLAEAELCLREALEAQRRTLGNEHLDVLTSINMMGRILARQGKLNEAESCYREALDTTRRVRGAEHPETLRSMTTLAGLLYRQGRLGEAEPYCRQVYELRQRTLGQDHKDTLISMDNLSMLLYEQKKPAEAEPICRQALDGMRRVLGNEHPDTLTSLTNIAWMLDDLGRLEEAEQCLREATAGRQRALGPEHPETLRTMNHLASILRQRGQLEEAETLGAELAKLARSSSNKDQRTAALLGGHGKTLLAMKRYSDAAQELEDAHAILVTLQASSEVAKITDDVVSSLVSCYEAWHTAEPGAGHDAKAAEWRAKLPPEEAKPKEAAGD